MSATRLALLLALLPITAPRLPAQQPAPAAFASTSQTSGDSSQDDSSQPVTTIHVTSRVVVLDVVVTDGHGRTVKGLKPSDFTIFEDGAQQTLASFTERDAADDITPEELAPAPPLPPNRFAVQPPIIGDRTRTVIVLGALSFDDAPQARHELQKFMKTVPPGNPIAIFRGDWQGIHLIQDFTTDPRVLQEAANSQRILPPLGFPIPSKVRPLNTRGLATYLSSIPGRINLVWISDGGAPIGEIASSFPDVSNFLHDLNGTTSVLRLGRIAVYPIDANGVTVPYADQANFAGQADFDGAAVPPCMGASPFGQDPCLLFADVDLSDRAAATGGRSFFNNNGYAQAIAEVVATGSHYYTISYTPTNHDWNGALRRIRIEIPKDLLTAHESASEKLQDQLNAAVLQDPHIQYRSSYRARSTPDSVPDTALDTPDAAQQRRLISYSPKGDTGAPRGPLPLIQIAMGLGSAPPADLHFQITATPAAQIEKPKPGAPLPKGNFLGAEWRDKPYRNVELHYTLDPHQLQFSENGDLHHDALEIVAIVYRDDGAVVNSFVRKPSITLDDDQFTRMMAAPLELSQSIAIPLESTDAGNFAHYILRTSIHEVPTRRVGTIEVPAEWIKLPPTQTASSK